MRLHRDERGQTIILVALSLPLMLGFVGIATDVGALFKDKRDIQTAADAAAIAGALNLNLNYGNYVTAAKNASAANGFTDGSNGVTVTIKDPPVWPASNYYNKGGYVEATVSKIEPTIFLALFGHPSITVLARAVATNQGTGTGCIYTTGATGTTLTINNGATLTAPTCGVVVESNDPAAAMVVGGSGTFASIGSVGGASITGTISPAPITGIAPDSDPLNYLPQYSFSTGGGRRRTRDLVSCASGYDCTNSPVSVPTTCATTGGGVYNATAGTTLTPGCYANLTFPGGGTVTLDPGLYIVDGDLTFGAGNVTGSGVTLYYSGQLLFGTGTYTLTAPNDPTQLFNGILFAESAFDTDSFTLNGSANSTIQGIFYAPGTSMSLNSAPAYPLNVSFVFQSLTLGAGGPSALTNYGSLSGIQSPLNATALVE